MTRPLEIVLVKEHQAEARRCIASMRHVLDALSRPSTDWSVETDSWTTPMGEAGGCVLLRRCRSDQVLIAERSNAIAPLRTVCILVCPADMPRSGDVMAAHATEVMKLVETLPWHDADEFAGMDDWILGAAAVADPTEHHVGVVDLATPWTPTRLEDGMGAPASMPRDVLERFDAAVPMSVTVSTRFIADAYRLNVSSSYRWSDPAILWSPSYDPLRTLRVMTTLRAAGVIAGDRS